MTHILPLQEEREALSQILFRLMNEETSLDNLCKYVPRIVSVTATVVRVQAALQSNDNEATDTLLRLLAELAEEEEQPQA